MDSFDLDKALGIICLTGIAVLSIFKIPDGSDTVVIPIVTAIAGFITGRVTSQIKSPKE